ncbi:MAG: tyrosine-type recombinase/integrase [Clostridiales bacterium]|nr:tyrosine-type recombinase/integrase [Clostridiales bacterium]
MLKSVDNLKYKAMFELMYCGGLRVSEVTELKATDINSKDTTIFIDDGKGGKDR